MKKVNVPALVLLVLLVLLAPATGSPLYLGFLLAGAVWLLLGLIKDFGGPIRVIRRDD